MEFDESSMDYTYSEIRHDYPIKESRKIRKNKINTNQAFHKKHPKSIEHYKNLELNNAPMESIMEKKNSQVVTANPTQQQHSVSPKLKGNIQLMFQNLSKHYKKEGIFFDSANGYQSISVMKDFNVHSQIGETRTALTLRAIVGSYPNLKDIVVKHGTHFSILKKDFHQWWQSTLNNYDPRVELEGKLEQLFSFYKQDPRIEKFLPSLENKLIQALRKPTKQTQGFLNKIQQIDSFWLEEAKEIVHIETIENELRFSEYEDSFPLARNMDRKFKIFVGPTNSGKTHAALNILAEAKNGSYLGPLRLMAHEGKDALQERGVTANLITGEERIETFGATHTSSTVEMCSTNRIMECAVIDEIQMIADPSRGWAWSQALVGVPAREVVLVGSEEALPFIIPVIENLGEKYEIVRFERKNKLEIRDAVNKFKNLKAGDCVVVFSRKSALEMKNAIEASGKKCSVIYGNLSPEVRRSEANKFKSGENPILIATDAIGMGLNLPIHRLFFSTLEKFDGVSTRLLNVSEIKQIAGRAGRYGFNTHGEVGLLFDDNSAWRNLLNKAIYAGYESVSDHRISIAPNLKQIQTICNTLGKQDLYSALIFFKEKMIRDHKFYKTANLEAMIEIASLLKNKDLDLATGLNYACVPVDTSSDVHMKHFFRWVNNHIQNKETAAPIIPDVVIDKRNDSYSLYEAENYVKLCMAYRWLHYKFPILYPEIETVTEYGKITNSYIEYALHKHIVISQNPRWRK